MRPKLPTPLASMEIGYGLNIGQEVSSNGVCYSEFPSLSRSKSSYYIVYIRTRVKRYMNAFERSMD